MKRARVRDEPLKNRCVKRGLDFEKKVGKVFCIFLRKIETLVSDFRENLIVGGRHSETLFHFH